MRLLHNLANFPSFPHCLPEKLLNKRNLLILMFLLFHYSLKNNVLPLLRAIHMIFGTAVAVVLNPQLGNLGILPWVRKG